MDMITNSLFRFDAIFLKHFCSFGTWYRHDLRAIFCRVALLLDGLPTYSVAFRRGRVMGHALKDKKPSCR